MPKFIFLFVFVLGWGGSDFLVETVCSSNSHMVDAIRMQMEVQRRLHEQLEVTKLSLIKPIINSFTYLLHLLDMNYEKKFSTATPLHIYMCVYIYIVEILFF